MVIALNLSRDILDGMFDTVNSGQVGGAAPARRPPPRPRTVQLQREGEDGCEEQDSQAAPSQQHSREVGLQEWRDGYAKK